MYRKRYVILPIIIAIITVVSLLIGHRYRPVVPLLKHYNICYGDSPVSVAAKVLSFGIKDKPIYTDHTVYSFRTDVLDKDAEINCFFLKDRELTEVDIIIPCDDRQKIDSLFVQASLMIQEEYKADESFFCDSIVYVNETDYYLCLGLREGAVGIYYKILVTEKELRIYCIYSR